MIECTHACVCVCVCVMAVWPQKMVEVCPYQQTGNVSSPNTICSSLIRCRWMVPICWGFCIQDTRLVPTFNISCKFQLILPLLLTYWLETRVFTNCSQSSDLTELGKHAYWCVIKHIAKDSGEADSILVFKIEGGGASMPSGGINRQLFGSSTNPAFWILLLCRPS